MITHFQLRETKGKDYFRKAWHFQFLIEGQWLSGIYHQDGTIDWNGEGYSGAHEQELTREIHRLMSYHVFR
ncbi:DUF5342 family protein [Ammoniphilus sp. CFH 90114]|uniref:DUF5342 family protein n=1 Tax=Ammoniphilus sp. CFH 90114 TaxID=2493665 RepID=UPI00100E8208|nr:DUF5342 family protein [Ammoniphilus sp. CFH 90114]RXT04117.1 hypothetical protein EIZ39_21290 [Ammoniphilus sp. CFH 90114]